MHNVPQEIRLYGTQEDSIVDGPGLRFSIFTQGCTHHCVGCHNPESQDLEGGYLTSIDGLIQEIVANEIIQGITFSGGEPFLQASACRVLAGRLKAAGFNVWIYSGFLYEDIWGGKLGEEAKKLLELCDVLVDGPFIQKFHRYDLLWRGSSNQRIIDLVESIESGRVTFWESNDDFPAVPTSW